MTRQEGIERVKRLLKANSNTQWDPRFGPVEGNGPDEVREATSQDWDDSAFGSRLVPETKSVLQKITDLADEGDPEIVGILRATGIEDNTIPHGFHTGNADFGWDGLFFYEPQNNRFVFNVKSRGDQGSKTLFIESKDGDFDVAKVKAAKLLQGDNGTHKLNERERLHVERLATSNWGTAITCYLNYAYPQIHDEEESWNILVDPHHAARLSEAVFYVFRISQTQISDDDFPEFQKFAARYLGERQPTIALLNTAMTAFLQNRAAETAAEVLAASEEAPPDYDAMSDQEIETALDSAAREYNRAIRNQRR